MNALSSARAAGRWSRRVLSHARGSMMYAIPAEPRSRIAAALPARLLPPEMRPGFFDHLFDEGDPFGFDSNPEEQLKFQRTLEMCGEGQLGHVLELGCAVGSFTEILAPRASAVLAVDRSPAAVDHVARRLRHHRNVRTKAMTIPAEFPDGPFDVVVASDVLYYLSVEVLRRCVARIEAALSDGAAFVAVHYVPRMGSFLSGDEAHDLIAAHTTLRHVVAERTEFGAGRTYRLDRFEKA